MFFSKILSVAAALATTAAALPTPAPVARGINGGVTIINNMGQDIYLWSVAGTSAPMTILPAGEAYQETWRTNPSGGGISIKLGCSEDLSNVLQYEYTMAGEMLFWDMSSIDLKPESPLITAGFNVRIDDSSCDTVTCAPGDVNCSESYQFPNDHNTRACSTGAAYTLTLG
ncbi:putative antigenic thaumatin domain protein [Aspergillus undulatus]|uniref:putative antigenic thaumatin domain protein n=1 Tax=Aspergillus undulatus TaxID=1810928 RepID=UPI003CCCD112